MSKSPIPRLCIRALGPGIGRNAEFHTTSAVREWVAAVAGVSRTRDTIATHLHGLADELRHNPPLVEWQRDPASGESMWRLTEAGWRRHDALRAKDLL